MQSPEAIQERYYTEMAAVYDTMHVAGDDEHAAALSYISSFISMLGITSILDVGCGTGRGVQFFLHRYPDMHVHGIEPVQALIDQAVQQHGIPSELLSCGSGTSLPFDDASFEAVCEFSVLHHVRNPELVIQEMMRVSRKAIFLSDSNRFGQGGRLARWVKLALYKGHLWNAVNLLKTRGRGYTISAGDGLAYSYSVLDSYNTLANWAGQIILIPTSKEKPQSWFHPLLNSSNILLCAIK